MLKTCKNYEPQEPGKSLPTALELVTALTEEQHQHLRNFAAKRMRRLLDWWPVLSRCLARKSPDDIVHDALVKILLGESQPGRGRKLKVKNRESTDAFVHYVRAIINSELSNTIRSFEACSPQVSLSDPETEAGAVEMPEPLNFVAQVERHDLQRELFTRLELVLQKEPALAPVIRHWQEHFQVADRIGGPEFDRNLVHRVRQHAQRICRELAREIGTSEVTGVEMLL